MRKIAAENCGPVGVDATAAVVVVDVVVELVVDELDDVVVGVELAGAESAPPSTGAGSAATGASVCAASSLVGTDVVSECSTSDVEVVSATSCCVVDVSLDAATEVDESDDSEPTSTVVEVASTVVSESDSP